MSTRGNPIIGFRAEIDLINRIDEYIEKLKDKNPGHSYDRSGIVRNFVIKGLDAAERLSKLPEPPAPREPAPEVQTPVVLKPKPLPKPKPKKSETEDHEPSHEDKLRVLAVIKRRLRAEPQWNGVLPLSQVWIDLGANLGDKASVVKREIYSAALFSLEHEGRIELVNAPGKTVTDKALQDERGLLHAVRMSLSQLSSFDEWYGI